MQSRIFHVALVAALAALPASLAGQEGRPGVDGSAGPRGGDGADERLPTRDELDFREGAFEEVTVTAPGRTRQRVGTDGRSVTVLQGEALRRAGVASVADALRRVPGIEVDRAGGLGTLATVRIRGAESDHALVLIDGVRVNEPGGFRDLFDLDLEAVERIEVYRGPGSAAWGPDSVSGVINIVTEQGEGPARFGAGIEGGSHQTLKESLWARGRSGAVSWHLAGSHLDTENDLPNNAFGHDELLGRFAVEVGGSGQLDWTARFTRSDIEDPDDGGGGAGPRFIGNGLVSRGFFGSAVVPGDDFTRDVSYTNGLAYTQQVTERWSWRLGHQFYRQDLATIDRPTRGKQAHSFVGRQGLELSTTVEPVDGARSSLGIDWLDSEVSKQFGAGTTPTELRSISRGAWFEESVETAAGLNLVGGVRLSSDTDYGSDTSWRGSAAWLLDASGSTLRGAYGTAFKAPSVFDLAGAFGNPLLQPEEVESWEAGADQRIGRDLSLGATWFDQRFSDLIAFSAVTFKPENIGQAESDGLEASARWTPSEAVALVAGYTWTRSFLLVSSNNTRRQRQIRRPEHQGSLTLDLTPAAGLGIGLSAVAVGKSADDDFFNAIHSGHNANTRAMDYLRLDLGARYRQGENLEYKLAVENLLDEDYEEVAGFPANGVVATGGVELSF